MIVWEECGELPGGFLRFLDEVEVEVEWGEVSVVVFEVGVVESEEGMEEELLEEE
jgi:hypothetical protein